MRCDNCGYFVSEYRGALPPHECEPTELRLKNDRIRTLAASLKQADTRAEMLREDLLALAGALHDTFSCDLEGEGNHEDHEAIEECWRCWSSRLLVEWQA